MSLDVLPDTCDTWSAQLFSSLTHMLYSSSRYRVSVIKNVEIRCHAQHPLPPPTTSVTGHVVRVTCCCMGRSLWDIQHCHHLAATVNTDLIRHQRIWLFYNNYFVIVVMIGFICIIQPHFWISLPRFFSCFILYCSLVYLTIFIEH